MNTFYAPAGGQGAHCSSSFHSARYLSGKGGGEGGRRRGKEEEKEEDEEGQEEEEEDEEKDEEGERSEGGVHRNPWVPMYSYGFLWIPMSFNGIL